LNLGLEDYDPLQVPGATDNCSTDEEDEQENDVDDEDGRDDEIIRDKSEATGNSNTAEEDEMEIDFDDAINCNKCQKWETRCRKLQQEIDAMRLKLNQLDQRLHLNEEDSDEEEQIWLLIK